MVANPGDPIAINASAGAPAYTAAEFRRALAALGSPKGAAAATPYGSSIGPRVGYGANLVSLAGSTITVKAHAGVISPDLTITQGAYLYQLPSDSTLTLTAPHATLVRNDLVVLRVDDNDEDASGNRQVIPVYVEGTPGAGVPALPARSFELARINVPQSGGGAAVVTERNRWTTAAGGVIPVRDQADRDDTNLTPYAGRAVYRLDSNRFEYRGASAYRTLEVIVPCTSGTRPAHQEGLVIYETDTDRILASDGSSWVRLSNTTVAGRTGTRLRRVANQSITSGAPTSISWDTEDADTDGFIAVTGPTVTIPAGLGGLYAITAWALAGAALATRAYMDLIVTSAITGFPANVRYSLGNLTELRYLIGVTVPLLAGDSFVVQLFHSTGSAVNHTAWLSCYRVGT